MICYHVPSDRMDWEEQLHLHDVPVNLQNNCMVHVKNLRVKKGNKNRKKHSRLMKTKETWQINATH